MRRIKKNPKELWQTLKSAGTLESQIIGRVGIIGRGGGGWGGVEKKV